MHSPDSTPPRAAAHTPPVTFAVEDGVAMLTIHNPPVNAISATVRRGLWLALEDLQTDARVSCVVIAAGGEMFSGGGDLRELGQPQDPQGVSLGDLAARVENFSKPVAIALQGKAIGGGVLLAMACHARIGAHDTQLALPEVNLGFVPGAGGTQRLPRLVGVEAALRMVALAEPMNAQAAVDAGLLDSVVPPGKGLREAARELARALARGQRAWRRTATLAVPGAWVPPQRLDAMRARVAQRFPDREAAQAAIDLIANAASTTFEDGLQAERACYDRLAGSEQTRELLAAFFAARAAARERQTLQAGEKAKEKTA